MKWHEVKRKYPEKWLLIEAISAFSKNKRRIIEELTVIDFFEDSEEAMKKYLQLHKDHPDREMYVVHTSRSELELEEILWTGPRVTQ